ncbi:MAG: hypothetical protein KatS3mg119_0392 [Rhodothalassiaceae bacterium]|nr:MAG: hypothetical protein KatS3mg119_0392 [Rhodothalassiaceae bacterium]
MTDHNQISEARRRKILEKAWNLIVSGGRLDLGLSELARACGVSRQTLYLAFGSREGLLLEMVRWHDRNSPTIGALIRLSREGRTARDMLDFTAHWLDHLPKVFPVAMQLECGASSGGAAVPAWENRMFHGLLHGFRAIAERMGPAAFTGGLSPREAADTAWSLVQPSAWHLLVVRCGWSPESFRRNRMALVSGLLADGAAEGDDGGCRESQGARPASSGARARAATASRRPGPWAG